MKSFLVHNIHLDPAVVVVVVVVAVLAVGIVCCLSCPQGMELHYLAPFVIALSRAQQPTTTRIQTIKG